MIHKYIVTGHIHAQLCVNLLVTVGNKTGGMRLTAS